MLGNSNFSEIPKEGILKVIDHSKENIVYLSGSLIEGIGNHNSDIDVYILVDSSSELENIQCTVSSGNTRFVFAEYGSRPLDIEYWDLHEVRGVINTINNLRFEDVNLRAGQQLNPRYMSFIHRLIVGYPILNEERFDELIHGIKLDNYFRWSSRYKIADVDNLYEDVIGNYETGDYKTAFLMCNVIVTRCLHAYLFNRGISTDRDKWVFKKLELLAKSDGEALKILREYENLLIFVHHKDMEDVKKSIEGCIRFTNRIINLIQSKGDGI